MMWILILAFTVATAEQVTQYRIDYGTHVGEGTMVEDDDHQKIVFSAPTGQTRMDTIVVDYNQSQIILKSDRRIQCVVGTLKVNVKSQIEEYKKKVLTAKLVKALYFDFVKSTASEDTTKYQPLVDEVCPEYDIIYVKSITASTTPPRHRKLCWHHICIG